MFYQLLLYSIVTQSHIYTYIYIHSFSHIIFSHVLSQVIEYGSLCYTVGLVCSCKSRYSILSTQDGAEQEQPGREEVGPWTR